jgi:hypothetical protein
MRLSAIRSYYRGQNSQTFLVGEKSGSLSLSDVAAGIEKRLRALFSPPILYVLPCSALVPPLEKEPLDRVVDYGALGSLHWQRTFQASANQSVLSVVGINGNVYRCERLII